MLDVNADQPIVLWIVIGFLAISLLLYCLLGGADFGAGVLEIFLRKKQRTEQYTIIEKAMGPVWEANHMWLILMVVILFMGFPSVYSLISIHLHLPLTAMLVGIIARGCSFTFRHYDAKKGRSQKSYAIFFVFSSVWTPLCLGVVMGALIPGGIHPDYTTYREGFIDPWLRPFPLALGVFTVYLFGGGVFNRRKSVRGNTPLVHAARARCQRGDRAGRRRGLLRRPMGRHFSHPPFSSFRDCNHLHVAGHLVTSVFLDRVAQGVDLDGATARGNASGVDSIGMAVDSISGVGASSRRGFDLVQLPRPGSHPVPARRRAGDRFRVHPSFLVLFVSGVQTGRGRLIIPLRPADASGPRPTP